MILKLLIFLAPAILIGQTLDPAVLHKPLGTVDGWNTYSGDYSGKRYSVLTGGRLARTRTGPKPHHRRDREDGGGAAAGLKAAILEVDGTLYGSMPDNAWAVDARNGQKFGISCGRRAAARISATAA